MKNFNHWMVMILMLLVVLLLAACNGGSEQAVHEEPAQVVEVAGSEFNKVILTARAAERLGIQSEPVREESIDGSIKLVIPYAAIIYGLHGETWAYMRNPGGESLTFVRTPITVDRIEGDMVILTDGPAVGTDIVTVGVAELYGTDTGVGK